MAGGAERKVLVLVNPRSGVRSSFDKIRQALDAHWEAPDVELSYQFCQDVADSQVKARRAADRGVDTILVVGGDGTVSTVGRALLGTPAALGCIPMGSGNGFARHFGIPLQPVRAVRALREAEVRRIDVGVVNGTPFLVTCSMAWDASLVRIFEKMPVRGILPYVFAGVQGLFEYRPQPFRFELDSGETLDLPDPLVCTVANLTQYGGGAIIAPQAMDDDGHLELIVALRQDLPRVIGRLGALFDGSLMQIPEVISRRFRTLRIVRQHAAALQIDGELVEAPAEVLVNVVPAALNVLIPRVEPRQA